MKKIHMFICVVVLFIAVVLVLSSIAILTGEDSDFEEGILLGEMLRNDQALNFYPRLCIEIYSKGYGENARDPLITDARKNSQEICRSKRDEQIEKWSAFMESSESDEALGRAFFYIGGFHYTDAYDNHSLESAELAVDAYERSLIRKPGSATEGYSDFDIKRRERLENALILRNKIAAEEEKKKQEQEASRPQLQEGGREEENQEEGKKEEVDGIEVPIVEPGVKP